MLEGSEYSPWVKTIFESIKTAALFRGVRYYSRLNNYLIEEVVKKGKSAQQKLRQHWRYTSDRVDRRLKREPEHGDLWSKILAKDGEEGGLTYDEHLSNASLFMIAYVHSRVEPSLRQSDARG